MKRVIENYKTHMTKALALQISVSLLFLILSLVINYYSSIYTEMRASNSVSDIILSNTRVYDIDFLFVYGTLFFWLFIVILFIFDPKRAPFCLKTVALFVIIRSISVSLTHIASFPNELVIHSGNGFLDLFYSSSSLFFSGHTGMPFLLALIFWKDEILRYVLLCCSLFFAIIVLLGHLHYTIDVFAAFFITYSVYSIAEFAFKNDRKLFYHQAVKSAPELI